MRSFGGLFYTILSSFLISLAFVIAVFMLGITNPETSSTYWFSFGLLGSFIYMFLRKRHDELKIFKRYWKPMLFLGILNGSAVILWFYTIDMIGPSITSFLMRFVTVFSILLGVIFLKERFVRFEIVGLIITIIGAFIITYTGGFLIAGAFMVLMLSFIISMNNLVLKIYVKNIKPALLNQFRLIFATLIIFLYSVTTGSLKIPSPDVVLLSMAGGIVVTLIGFNIYYKALEKMDLSKVMTIRSLDPFVVLLYSFIFFGELLTAEQFIGGLIIVAGIIILALARSRPKIIERWMP